MPGTNLTREEAQERAAVVSTETYVVELDLTQPIRNPVRLDHDDPVRRHTRRLDVRRPRRRRDLVDHAQRHRRSTRPSTPTAASRSPTSRPTTSCASRPPAPTRTPARACTASSTRSTAGSTSTRSSRCPTPAACSPRSSSPTSRPRSSSTSPRRPAGRSSSNSPTPEPETVRDGVAVWHFAPTERMSTYITALVAGEYHVVRDVYRGEYDEIPLGLFCRQSLVEHLDADDIFAHHQAGLRVLRGRLRDGLPVRQVRPAVRAGVQHGRDGERRLRDVPRRAASSAAARRSRPTSSGPTRSCTRWRTCGSATS